MKKGFVFIQFIALLLAVSCGENKIYPLPESMLADSDVADSDNSSNDSELLQDIEIPADSSLKIERIFVSKLFPDGEKKASQKAVFENVFYTVARNLNDADTSFTMEKEDSTNITEFIKDNIIKIKDNM